MTALLHVIVFWLVFKGTNPIGFKYLDSMQTSIQVHAELETSMNYNQILPYHLML